jgi:hypothetical protein
VYDKFQTVLEIEGELTSVSRTEKKVWFGTHRSTEAVMTCLVFSAVDNNHLHFIDGSHGGYAMAAKQMKARKVSHT